MEQKMVSEDFRRQLEGYGLTTARILYRRPDHRWLLQSYVWQDRLEGPLHSVTVAHARLIRPAEIRTVGGEFKLH